MRLSVRTAAEKVVRRFKADFGEPDWSRLRKRDADLWQEALRHAEAGPKVLMATSAGGHTPSTTIESLLAVALTLRGANVHLLLCDKALPACMQSSLTRLSGPDEFSRDGPQKAYCWDCFDVGEAVYRSLGLPLHHYSEYVTAEEVAAAEDIARGLTRAEIEQYRPDGLAIGEHALAGTLRFFARGSLDGEVSSEAVIRRYLRASIITAHVVRGLLGEYDFACCCFNHGIYVPQGLIGEVARRLGVRVVNWNPAYRKKRFIFSHGDSYHHTMMTEPTDQWEDMPWHSTMEAELLEYLRSRWQGEHDWIYFHDRPIEDVETIAAEMGIDFSKPTVGMLTNVFWDAQLHYKANAFSSMLEWTVETIRYFGGREDLQLVIRVHPAELRGFIPSKQPIIPEIHREFSELPSNVFLIPPESRISTYPVMLQCNAVIIYGTKTGVELSSMGVPVIVAGEAWIRNKGITWDASSPQEYFSMLDQLPLASRMDEEKVQRARKYAYHFFFRRMVPIQCIEPARRFAPYRIELSALEDLLPGRDPGLDVICDGILNGSAFVYPEEKYLLANHQSSASHLESAPQ